MSTGRLPQNIRGICVRKRCGKIQTVVGMMYLLFLVVFLYTQLQTGIFMDVSLSMEDSLAASNLASAVVDIEEYGISHRVWIKDYDVSYEIFLDALKNNLKLDDGWEKGDSTLLQGSVNVDSYIIYNVAGGVVEVKGFEEGSSLEYSSGVGSVATPDGTLVENTGIYSKISFPVKGFLGLEHIAQKSKFVDIAVNN